MTSNNAPQLSIIIPTLNEVETLPILLNALTQQQNIRSEIIIADGGSTDGTTQISIANANLRVISCPLGRGKQMNAGAAVAQAPWLLFLHADSRIDNRLLLSTAVAHCSAEQAGHFALRFVDRPGHALRYTILEQKTTLTRENTNNGDQGLLIHRDLFRKTGGFSTRWHFLEDQILNEQLRKRGQLTRLPGQLYTSARRFESEGFGSRYSVMALLMTAWDCGLHEFIDNARDGYRQQQDTHKLSLGPFLKLFKEEHQKRPLMQRMRLIVAYGSYLRRNAWQPFLWLGCLLFSHRQSRLLWMHDRLLFPALKLPIVKQTVEPLLGILACLLFFHLAPLILQLRPAKPR